MSEEAVQKAASNLNLRRRLFKTSKSSSSSSSSSSSQEAFTDDDPKLAAAKRSIKISSKEQVAPTTKPESRPISYGYSFILLMALIVRLAVGLHGYSGQGNSPTFGDFEAQRHWMEITLNTPIAEWYIPTERNDLSYWGLDYPPLSAYWAYVTGFIAEKIDPEWVALGTSRGFESAGLKTYMRLTAIVCDLLIMMTGAVFLSRSIPGFSKAQLLVALLTPGFILVDHGHFQYNSAMLGFMLWSMGAFLRQKYAISVMFIFLSISFKHMNLYSVPAFGMALLGVGLSMGDAGSAMLCYFRWGVVKTLTLAICFAPFLHSYSGFLAVLRRLFPVHRGLFEEKVATFWCSLAILTKFHRKYRNSKLFQLCAISFLTAMSPVALGLLLRASKRALRPNQFVLGLSYVCLCAYLFAYHVHEKQILIPLLPIAFLSSHSPWFTYFFTIWSTFSLYPLMRKDGLQLAYFCLQFGWTAVFYLIFKSKLPRIPSIWKLLIVLSLDFIVLHHLCQAVWTPPSRLPDLFLVLNALGSFAAFSLSALYLLHQFWFGIEQ